MTGGVGIAAEWMGDADGPDHWRDTHVRVRGPVVRGLQGAFAENWLEGTGEVLAGDDYLPDLEPVDDGGPMQVVRSSAKVGDTNAEALYYLAIASARRSIELTAAYFVPRPAFTQALCDAAERGVDVRVLVPGPAHRQGLRPDRRPGVLRAPALGAGVRLFEYQPTMLHAKTLCRRRHAGRRSARSTSTTARSSSTTRSRWGSGTSASPASCTRRSSATSSARTRSIPTAGAAAVPPSASARPRPLCSAASSDPPILRSVRGRSRSGGSRSPQQGSRRCSPDGGAIPCWPRSATPTRPCCRLLRTRGHQRAGRGRDARARHGGRVRRRLGRDRRRRRLDRRCAGAASGCSRASPGPPRSGSTSPPSSRSAGSGR